MHTTVNALETRRDVGVVPGARVTNVMSIDVEDYFQVSAFEDTVSRSAWPSLESRVLRNTERLLEIFEDAGVAATFFVLGWVAERHPALVRRIAATGHEVASHGHEHRLVYAQSPQEFADDVRRSRAILEDASGTRVIGYRAPSYSIVRDSLWALDVLIEQGYLYDSSIYPIHHDRYGIPGWERFIHRINRPNGGSIWELPGTTMRWAGANLPVGGGGYFRLLPYSWTRLGFEQVNAENRPVIFYLHPWEIDPDQPRLAAGMKSWRHYGNLRRTEGRLQRLLSEFAFAPVGTVLKKTLTLSRIADADPLLASARYGW